MNTEQLRYFIAVAQYKNFSKAAEKLFIGQPALSRQISRLEEQLGVKLFIRSSKSVELTLAGEILLKQAESIIHRLDRLKNEIHLAEAGVYGKVRIATLGGISKRTNEALYRTCGRMEHCVIELERFEQEFLKESLYSGQLDVVLTYAFSLHEPPEEIEIVPLEEAGFVCLVSKSHRLYRESTVRAEDLRTERLILLEVSKPPACVEALLQQSLRPPSDAVVYTKGIDTMIIRVEAGMGIGIVPEFVMNNYAHYGISGKKIADLPMQETIALAWRRTEHNPAIERFAQQFLDCYENEAQ